MIFNDYKKNLLAIGCYYFCNYEFLSNFFEKNRFFSRIGSKEYYLVTLLNFLIRVKIKVNYFIIKIFVFWIASSILFFINWKRIVAHLFNLKLVTNVMLMAGKLGGKRTKKKNLLPNINGQDIWCNFKNMEQKIIQLLTTIII